jgi:hypothetical protein
MQSTDHMSTRANVDARADSCCFNMRVWPDVNERAHTHVKVRIGRSADTRARLASERADEWRAAERDGRSKHGWRRNATTRTEEHKRPEEDGNDLIVDADTFVDDGLTDTHMHQQHQQ